MLHRVPLLLVAIGSCPALVPAAQSSPATAELEDFVIVQKGTLPIIVSAPHGGRKAVPDVPERKGVGITNFATVLDSNTLELSEVFSAELEKKLDGKPW